MTNRPFNEQMDDFSALVIYLHYWHSRCSRISGVNIVQRNARGQSITGMLLFTGDDLRGPDKSLLFAELLRCSDSRIRRPTQALIDACKHHVTQVRFPMHLLDPDYDNKQSLQKFEQAIQLDDDDQIIKLWVAPLTAYGPAQRHLPRVTEAKRRVAAVASVKRALATHDIFQIADAASPELATSRLLSVAECEIIRVAGFFVQAYRGNDDDQIVNNWQEIQNGPYHTFEAWLTISTATGISATAESGPDRVSPCLLSESQCSWISSVPMIPYWTVVLASAIRNARNWKTLAVISRCMMRS